MAPKVSLLSLYQCKSSYLHVHLSYTHLPSSKLRPSSSSSSSPWSLQAKQSLPLSLSLNPYQTSTSHHQTRYWTERETEREDELCICFSSYSSTLITRQQVQDFNFLIQSKVLSDYISMSSSASRSPQIYIFFLSCLLSVLASDTNITCSMCISATK